MNPKPEWHCRIGNVTRKGGATVRVLRPGHDPTAARCIKVFHDYAKEVAGQFTCDAAGFVMVMWDRSGRYSRARYATPGSPFGRRTMPDVVAGVLRQDTMADVTRGVLRGDE